MEKDVVAKGPQLSLCAILFKYLKIPVQWSQLL